MHESSHLTEFYASELSRQRRQQAALARTARALPRRSTRRSLAQGLHRLADRLDG